MTTHHLRSRCSGLEARGSQTLGSGPGCLRAVRPEFGCTVLFRRRLYAILPEEFAKTESPACYPGRAVQPTCHWHAHSVYP